MNELRNRRKGVVIVLIALGASFFFGLAGLAVDTIYIYAVKARLVTAVDACALAAARSIGRGQTEMNRIVDMIFNSNFPTDMLMTISRSHTTPLITNVPAQGRREVSLTGTAVVPTLFMRIFGWNQVTVNAGAQAARRDVNIMLILDRSGSMMLAPGPPWPQLQDAAKFFVNQFDTTADRLGLITFGTSARVDYAMNYSPGVDFKTNINNIITSHQVNTANRTNPTEALYLAYKELNTVNDPTALNAVVFFTDGQPTAFSNWFKVRTSGTPSSTAGSPRYGVVHTSQDHSSFRGLARAFATGIPGSSSDIVQLASTVTGNGGDDVNTLLSPAVGAGNFYPYSPEGVGVNPTFSITAGPRTVDSTGTVFVNGSLANRTQEIEDIALNASLEVAKLARNPATLNGGIRFYCIGLGGWLGPAEHGFLKSIANTVDQDAGYPAHDPNQPAGIYYYAPGPSQLRQAFQTVASEIFRLIQ